MHDTVPLPGCVVPDWVLHAAMRASVSVGLDILAAANVLPRLPDGTYSDPRRARAWSTEIQTHFIEAWKAQLQLTKDRTAETI